MASQKSFSARALARVWQAPLGHMLRLKVGNGPLAPISRTFLCQCSCAGGGCGGAGVLPTHYWTKEHVVLERLSQGRSSAFPVSQKTYPICILTKQPKAKPKCLNARLQNQSFERTYINILFPQFMHKSHLYV